MSAPDGREPLDSAGAAPLTLTEQTTRAAFWNALLLPVLAALNLAFSIVVRRSFSLSYAGVYDTALGVVATLMLITSLGISTSLTKFLPEMLSTGGPPAAVLFLRRVGAVRLLLVGLAVIPLNVFAPQLAEHLNMGDLGVLLLRLVSVMVFARALIDLSVKTLNAFFGQLRSNLVALSQATLDFILVGAAVYQGYRIDAVFGMVVVGSVVASMVGIGFAHRALSRLPESAHGTAFRPADAATTRAAVGAERARWATFAAFTFAFELSLYFSGKGFSSPALAIILGPGQVALFTAAFNLAFMTVGLMVASFRGLYRPMFAHLRTRDDPDQLRRAFATITKAQLVVLVPAGVGLTIMAADYLPLMFGAPYAPAIPVARVLVPLFYIQTAFNLGMIWLSIDERYRAVLWAQALLVGAAPFLLIVAGSHGLVWAAVLFGGTRVVVAVAGYLLCHRDYGFRFPWRFALKVSVISALMGFLLVLLRGYWSTSLVEAIGLTALGATFYLVALRVARVLGAEEIELLERSAVPGKGLALAWLVPGR